MDNMHDYVLSRLEQARGRWPQVAVASGVSKRTIEKIARREIVDPGISHIQKLADYFQGQEGHPQ
jgi:transcriptional regulator with XRE-family HTH domain